MKVAYEYIEDDMQHKKNQRHPPKRACRWALAKGRTKPDMKTGIQLDRKC